MKTHFQLLFFSLFGAIISIQACKPENANQLNIDVEVQLVVDQNQADSEFDDVVSMATEIMSRFDSTLNSDKDTVLEYDNCLAINLTKAEKKISLDFGMAGCVGQDGRTRKGKIIHNYTGRLFLPGSIVYTAFENYEVKRNGSQVFLKIDNNSTLRQETVSVQGGQINFSRTMNARLNFVDGSAFTWQGLRNISWEYGPNLLNRFDDTWTVDTTSTSTGTNRRGTPFSVKLKNPLINLGLCMSQGIHKPVSGKLDIVSTNIVRSINYGEGTCNNMANLTVNGVQRTILLP